MVLGSIIGVIKGDGSCLYIYIHIYIYKGDGSCVYNIYIYLYKCIHRTVNYSSLLCQSFVQSVFLQLAVIFTCLLAYLSFYMFRL